MPDVEIQFHPETKSQAKGRNGYFQLEIRSKRISDHPPIVLNLTTEDTRLLRDGLDRLLLKLHRKKF